MKKILILILLVAVAFGSYYLYKNYIKPKILKEYTSDSEFRDKALNNLTINEVEANYGTAIDVVAKWDSLVKTNPATSSVKMEIIVTETSSAKGKKVIAFSIMKGITAVGLDKGSIRCNLKPMDITSDKPYVWVRISATIDGKVQPPIIKLLGKFNR